MHHPQAQLFDFTVVSNEPCAHDIYRLVIDAPELAKQILPGQFMNLEVPGDSSHILRIPLSFSSASANKGTIELIYALVGEGTRRLADMLPGQTSTVVGPLGHGWHLPQEPDARCILVAGGVGAPPIVACASFLRAHNISCDVILGAQTASKLWGKAECEALGVEHIYITTDDGTAGAHGFTTDTLAALLGKNTYTSCMTCGPTPMMAGVARLCEQANINCQASMERMMTCGFGACNTCNVALRSGGYASCCVDGPVMDTKEVAW